jgi:cytochrome b6-f complex iron-sulfur subunit
MKNLTECEPSGGCNNRRDFLVRATASVGGLVLSLSGAAAAQEKEKSKPADGKLDDFVIRLDEKSPLNKVGGSDNISTAGGKIIVVRTTENDFKAYSAICPHKGGPIKYDEKAGQLFCPWHNSRFDMTGTVVKGPANQPLKQFTSEKAVVVNLKPQG